MGEGSASTVGMVKRDMLALEVEQGDGGNTWMNR